MVWTKQIRVFLFLTIAVVFIKLLLLGQRIESGIYLTQTLDFSWQTDSIERFLHGFIAGRDFIFTYGPVYQILVSLPSLVFGIPSYSSLLLSDVLLTTISFLILMVILRLLTKSYKDQAILTVVLFLITEALGIDSNILIRSFLPFLYGLLFLRFANLHSIKSPLTVGLLSLPAFLGLYTYDLFVLCAVLTFAFVLYKVYVLYGNKGWKYIFKKYLYFGTIYLFIVFLYEIVVSLLLGGNLNYLTYSYDTLVNYQFVMNIPWTVNKSTFLLLIPVALVFFVFYIFKKNRKTRKFGVSFAVLTVVALSQLKSGFIRSDDAHILTSVYPSLFVLIIIGYLVFRKKTGLTIIIVTSALILFAFHTKLNFFSYKNLQNVLRLTSEKVSFFDVYRLPDNYYFTKDDFSYFSTLINKNRNKVLVYPYDNYILNINNSTYNTLPLQFYQYSDSIVEARAVSKLKDSPPNFIILGIDNKSEKALDDIPNLSRNPLVAKWIISNYSVLENRDTYLVLYLDLKKQQSKLGKSCDTYDVDLQDTVNMSILENLIKPSIFFLNYEKTIRLPITKNSNSVFVIEDFDNSESLEQLINNTKLFNKGYADTKELEIVKNYPIPKIKKVVRKKFNVVCY